MLHPLGGFTWRTRTVNLHLRALNKIAKGLGWIVMVFAAFFAVVAACMFLDSVLPPWWPSVPLVSVVAACIYVMAYDDAKWENDE